jgi:hypothetical protein
MAKKRLRLPHAAPIMWNNKKSVTVAARATNTGSVFHFDITLPRCAPDRAHGVINMIYRSR